MIREKLQFINRISSEQELDQFVYIRAMQDQFISCNKTLKCPESTDIDKDGRIEMSLDNGGWLKSEVDKLLLKTFMAPALKIGLTAGLALLIPWRSIIAFNAYK